MPIGYLVRVSDPPDETGHVKRRPVTRSQHRRRSHRPATSVEESPSDEDSSDEEYETYHNTPVLDVDEVRRHLSTTYQAPQDPEGQEEEASEASEQSAVEIDDEDEGSPESTEPSTENIGTHQIR